MTKLTDETATKAMFGFDTSGANSAWLAAIIRSSNDAIVSKTLDGTVLSWNPSAEAMFGFTEDEMIGESIRKIVPENRQTEEDEILSSISKGQRIDQFQTERLRKDGTLVPIFVSVSPILNDNGEVVGASKIARDISKELENRQKLEASERRFHAMADNISQLAWMADKNGDIFWYNKRWYDYTGTDLESMKGWGWKAVHHPDHVDRVVERIQHSWDTGEIWEDTFPLLGADGNYRWFLSRARPILDADGEISVWFGTNTDITEQRNREEQIKFLMQEVNHRSKNMLTMVQSIARYTSGPENADFLKKFGERVQSLASSQDLLLQEGWKGMLIEGLIHTQLGHFSDLIGTRIKLNGPPIYLDAKAVQPLGMAMHELATNSAKYGALSNETGMVQISWKFESAENGDPPGLAMSWIEVGGPVVQPPQRRGFGSLVIERMCKVAFSGVVTLNFDPDGLKWHLAGRSGAGLVAMTGD